MRRITVITSMLIIILTAGCSVMKSATVATTGNSITFRAKNLGLLSPAVTASEMAELINAQARADYMKNVVGKSGNGRKIGNYIIAIINNDPGKEVYFFDPEIPGYKIFLKPNGGVYLLSVQTIPREIALYSGEKKNARVCYKIHPLNDMRRYDNSATYKKNVLGIEVDLRYTINSI
ncbi:MAG: hypothetical protein WC582_01070 [Patescibacteria group bacterium]